MSCRIIVADVLDGLAQLEPGSVQCCVTSPPYWGLRDYGVAGQIGLERTPQEYVERMVAVFAAVRGVLKPTGTLWLNLGDCYNAYNGGAGPGSGPIDGPSERSGQRPQLATGYGLRDRGLKPKDLVGIPWRVALALQADGWWLRSDIVWSKPNPMPESITDRPTRSHEYLFLLARAARYYYDAAAIAEPIAADTNARLLRAHSGYEPSGQIPHNGTAGPRPNRRQRSPDGRPASPQIEDDPGAFAETRNARTVWEIATMPYPGAHFATFPPEIPKRCILAGSRPRDLVLDPFCGAGTAGLVADRLARDFVGIELNPAYAALAATRIKGDCPMFAEVSCA